MKFELASTEQLRQFVRSFYKVHKSQAGDQAHSISSETMMEDVETLARNMPGGALSIAQVQGFLMHFPNDPKAANEQVHRLLANPSKEAQASTEDALLL